MSNKNKKEDTSDSEEKSDRDILQRIKEKSEDDFEKNITYISAGALAISLTFLEKIIPVKESTQTYLVIVSWALLVLTLLSNLLSHQYSSYIIDKTINDVDNKAKKSIKNWERRTKKIRIWNILNVIGVMIGIGLFVIFVSINIARLSVQQNPKDSEIKGTQGPMTNKKDSVTTNIKFQNNGKANDTTTKTKQRD
jgi:hypothetical protein